MNLSVRRWFQIGSLSKVTVRFFEPLVLFWRIS
jgi:hypothetical protein